MHKDVGTVTFQYNRNQEVIYSYFNPATSFKKKDCKLKGNDEEFLKEEAKKLVSSWVLEIEKISEEDLFETKIEFEEILKEYYKDSTLIKKIIFKVKQIKLIQ